MNSQRAAAPGTDAKHSFLRDGSGNWMEFWYSIVPTTTGKIRDQISAIETAESELLKEFGIHPSTVAVKRLFSSDLMTHQSEIDEYKKRCETDFFMSLVEQPPACGAKIALVGMCLSNITEKHRDGNFFFFDTTSGVKHFWAEHLIDSTADEYSNSEQQTERVFDILRSKLNKFGTTIQDSVLRTWLYAPHVDADYPGIVKARRELFDRINLTKDTHYIASTGIQGGSGSRFARVCMDAFAVIGLGQDSIRYIQAPQHLSPTHIYGVTFERATAMKVGQTNFLFISGTASIDKDGEIVHPGDVVKQTERTLGNVDALLDSAGFVVDDLSSFIVYLRDPADYESVRPLIDRYAPELPAVFVKAPVCRPGWLMEIEATAARCDD